MISRAQFRIFSIYTATLYSAALLVFCGIIPSWGSLYSASPYHRQQVDAFLRGELALSHNPADLDMDLCWSEGGVHQVWGLGIPLWRLPFDALARISGYSYFPDRSALGCFMALAAYAVCRTWFSGLTCRKTENDSNPSVAAASGAVIISLLFPPLIHLLRSTLDHYGEPLVYVHFFGLLLACSVIALAKNPTGIRFGLVCALAGLGGLIRPTLVFYGFATVTMASLIMLNQEQRRFRYGTKVPCQFSFIWSPQLLLGLFLFLSGGGVLFITNHLRFGSGWEFGHCLNVSPALTSVYSTRFDYPFKHIPQVEAARELFGALFMVKRFNGVAWYEPGIFTWQSATIRWRGFDVTTYDLSYFVLLAAAWAFGLWLAGRWLHSTIKNRVKDQRSGNLLPPGYVLLFLWSILATVALAAFYLRVPAIADRYMMDFSPAFASSLAGLWWACTEKITVRMKHPNRNVAPLFILLIGWQGFEISQGKSYFGPPQSTIEEDILPQSRHSSQSESLPNQYTIGDSMESWGIPYNGEGWLSTNGQIWSCAIFFVESPQFLDLELAAATNSNITQVSLKAIQAKVGLEVLERNSISTTNGGWVLHFLGPQQSRYQRGLQPVFLAMVPPEDLGQYVIPPSPWILKRLSWRSGEKFTPL